MKKPLPNLLRRDFITTGGKAALATAALGAFPWTLKGALRPNPPLRGKAEHCIFLWLGGGMAQIDTWDPKRKSADPGVTPGSYYDSIATSVPSIRVCEHLPRSARLMDRMSIVRSMNYQGANEHAAATLRVHTGRPTTGTTRYPSIGSIVAHEKENDGSVAAPYVVIGMPSAARDPGFLGTKAGYLYVTDTKAGPNGLRRHDEVGDLRQQRRIELLKTMRNSASVAPGLAGYDNVISQSLDLAGPEFMSVFDLDQERGDLRQSYGGEFGQRCLLARRMVQRGVRFVEVSHNLNFVNGTGWDTHQQGQLDQHILIQELDHALASLVQDLEKHRLLDKTLVVVATEFGRPGSFDSGGGRGHHTAAYSMVFAGGGLKHGQAIGTTDELAEEILDRPTLVPDYLATICAAMGIDPAKELTGEGQRPVPITDGGNPIPEFFS